MKLVLKSHAEEVEAIALGGIGANSPGAEGAGTEEIGRSATAARPFIESA